MNDPTPADDYHRRKHAYLELLELTPEARERRLAAIARDDAALADALRGLLAAQGRAAPLLDQAPQPPVVVGPYRIVRELGRGGMGRVWLAERDLGDARQRVALKQLVHAGWSEEDRRRFERERRILARLQHPHIAALVDGGTDAAGEPWLATVLVEGERLDRWVAAKSPTLAARVRLLAKVARAVAYAHRSLVVHRDLKPANILVEGDGEPRLLDFGVGRLLAEEAVTATDASPVTLRYAAPEQVRGDGDASGVSSDIHALGILLYELVGGVSPHGEAREPAALVASVLNHVPAPPSAAATALAGADRDLDAIAAKALRKRAEDRYPSADAFADDLERWLAREPVEARRGERGYRARAFVRRRWPWFAAATVVLCTGVGFLAYDRARARHELEAVALERDKARAVAHFFQELFASATPNEVREGKLTARELLQRSVARLAEGDTASMPDDARGAMYAAAAKVMARQQMLDEADAMYARAVTVWRALPAPPADDLTAVLNDRAELAYRRGHLDQALAWQKEAIALRDEIGDRDSGPRGHLLQMLAIYQRMLGERDAAVHSLEEAAAILRAQLPQSRSYFAVVLGNLASFALYDGHAEQALAYVREGTGQILQLKPERVETVLNLQRMEAASLRELGRLDEAADLYDRNIARTRRDLDPHADVLAEAVLGKAEVLMLQQRWIEAEAGLREAEAIWTRNGGERHPRALTARSERSRILIAQQRWDEAIGVLEAVRALRPADSGSERSASAAEAVQLAYARCRRGGSAAEGDAQALREALPAMRRDPPLPRVRLGQAEGWLAECEARVVPRTT